MLRRIEVKLRRAICPHVKNLGRYLRFRSLSLACVCGRDINMSKSRILDGCWGQVDGGHLEISTMEFDFESLLIHTAKKFEERYNVDVAC